MIEKLKSLSDYKMYKDLAILPDRVFGSYEDLFEKITEDNWIQFGPFMELSVLSLFPYPKEWRPKFIDNKRIMPNIPEADKLKNKVDYVMR